MIRIQREIKISLSDIVLEDGESLSTKLSDIHKTVLLIGQELCLMRQSTKPVSVDLYETLECKCWGILNTLDDLKRI